jgi:hypothetical protein
MKNLTPLLCTLALVAACTPSTTSIDQQNENPLTASRYGDELADTMANLIIRKDPVLEQPGMRESVEKGIAEGKEIGAVARQIQKQGMMGSFISVSQSVIGYALLLDKTLYLSSDFFSSPGLNLHLYLTDVVDPRDTEFPDPNAVNIGRLQAVYGAQEYVLDIEDASALRTAVVWDATLKQIYGFAQLSR